MADKFDLDKELSQLKEIDWDIEQPLDSSSVESQKTLEDDLEALPPYSVKTNCSACSANVTTVVVPALKPIIWIQVLYFCSCGLWCCCCWLPNRDCMPGRDWFYKWRHYCGKCKKLLAGYDPPVTHGMKKHIILASIIGVLFVIFYIYTLGKYLHY